MSIGLSLAALAFFLAMNAFFVIAEFACVRVRRSQIDLAVEQGKRGAKNAKTITENVNAYLSACQLGITLASLAIGWLGEPLFSELIRPVCESVGIPSALISAISVAIGFTIMTTLHVVVGELIPKSFAILKTEQLALRTATPLLWFYRCTYPVMVVFNGLTNGVVRLTGGNPADEHEVYTSGELKLLIDESTESGLIEEAQNEYVDNVFDLSDKDAETIMTPRTDLICLDLEDSLDENRERIRQYKYTRYPVCEGNKDRIVGFVHVKDLYTMQPGAAMEDLPVRPIEAVPEGISIPKLLQVLQDKHTKIAVVVDEHGGTAGIVTMSDVMGQIVGRIDDEYLHETDEVKELSDGRYEIEGSLSVDELEELIGFLPKEADECETVGGLMMTLLDRIPAEGDEAVIADRTTQVTLRVEAMDRLRVDRVAAQVEHLNPEESSEE
ncbi:MAG: hemolysin family protein [Coriobacteriia bacterium]|nr:hemolysin family protein [Coriobacteriia bacterium]